VRLDSGNLLTQIAEFLAEDIGRGDITTQACVAPGTKGTGFFLAKENIVLCGLQIAEAVFSSLDPESPPLETSFQDGDEVSSGLAFAMQRGYADVLLAGERTALNLLQRLSGIATMTRQYVKAIEGTHANIVDTRKTTPGLRMLEKYAVMIGGGKNHRLGLDDGVLIKDNHISIAGGVRRAVEAAKSSVGHLHKIEVEVSNWAQLREAIEAGAEAILIDNQTPDEVRKLVDMAKSLNPSVIIEASGGITLENVRSYAETGVDLISVGKLTHSVKSVDISFKIQTS
jgi:nicotinate-nucleotide pyrophosphorylase (carboxylating)